MQKWALRNINKSRIKWIKHWQTTVLNVASEVEPSLKKDVASNVLQSLELDLTLFSVLLSGLEINIKSLPFQMTYGFVLYQVMVARCSFQAIETVDYIRPCH